MAGQAEIEIARALFLDGWSGGDVEGPHKYMTDDVVMRDIVGHPTAIRGWEGVRRFWERSADTLKVMPEEFFVSERGVALTWVAYGQLRDDRMGPENRGKWWVGEGMSRLEFRDGKVCLEVDYWHGPQGVVDDWEAHWKARQAMTPEDRGAISGAELVPIPPVQSPRTTTESSA